MNREYRTLLDTRPSNGLCQICGTPNKIRNACCSEIYEIFVFECPQCGANSFLLLQRE